MARTAHSRTFHTMHGKLEKIAAMPLTEKENEDLKKLIKDRVDNYPNLESMVAAGRLIYKSGWYEATSKEAYDAIIQYATSIRVSKEGKAQIKVARVSKRLKALAGKL